MICSFQRAPNMSGIVEMETGRKKGVNIRWRDSSKTAGVKILTISKGVRGGEQEGGGEVT